MDEGEKTKLTPFTERKILEYITQQESVLMNLMEKNFEGKDNRGLLRGYAGLRNSRFYIEKYLNETQDQK